MYKLKTPIIHDNDERITAIKKLFKEIFGYTDEEIAQFISLDFMCTVARGLTLEQIRLIAQPFEDYDALIVYIVEENTGHIISYHEAGIYLTKETPKDHYYDQPVTSRDQLVDPWTQKEKDRQENYAREAREEYQTKNTKPTITCPYCQSTNVSKIGTLGRMVSVGFWGLASGKVGKQWHCKKCGSDF